MADGVQISTSVTIISSLLGFQAISLSNMDTSAATVITAGSKVEIAGAFFNMTTDLTPNATSWTSISTASTAYIALTPAGTAGTQTVSASWVSDAPVWDDTKQAFYTTTSSSIRVIGGCYKNGATSYQRKFLLPTSHANAVETWLNTPGVDQTIVLRFASDTRLIWNETNDRFYIDKVLDILGNGLNLNYNGASYGANDVFVNFNTGAYIWWDHSATTFKATHPLVGTPATYANSSATENAIFDALDAYISATSNTVLVSGGLLGNSIPLSVFNVSYAIRQSATEIRLYGVEHDHATAGTPYLGLSYLPCNNGTGTAPVSSGSGDSYEECSIAWG